VKLEADETGIDIVIIIGVDVTDVIVIEIVMLNLFVDVGRLIKLLEGAPCCGAPVLLKEI